MSSHLVVAMEKETRLEEFSYLWDGSTTSWALFHLNVKKPDEPPRYTIVNVEDKSALLISDDELYAKVKQAMLDHGVRIVSQGNGF